MAGLHQFFPPFSTLGVDVQLGVTWPLAHGLGLNTEPCQLLWLQPLADQRGLSPGRHQKTLFSHVWLHPLARPAMRQLGQLTLVVPLRDEIRDLVLERCDSKLSLSLDVDVGLCLLPLGLPNHGQVPPLEQPVANLLVIQLGVVLADNDVLKAHGWVGYQFGAGYLPTSDDGSKKEPVTMPAAACI